MKESLIYPGKYTPLVNTKVLLNELILSKKESKGKVNPKMNLGEHDNYYKLEIMMPGIKRNEVVVYVHDNIVSVAGKQMESLKAEEDLKIHEFDTVSFLRHVFLPSNAGTSFIDAEFKAGILNIYIPKTNNPIHLKPSQIIVY